MGKKQILLIGHVSPLIHGQAVMSAQLASVMESWPDAHVRIINACYATDRGKLGGFSFRKLILWLQYLLKTLRYLCFSRVDTIVMTHSFFLSPFLKDSFFLWLGRLFRKKMFVWVHMDPSRFPWNTSSPLMMAYASRVLRIPDQWIACAPALINQWPPAFDRTKIIGICNGIPDPNPDSKFTKSDQIHVVFLSSMTQEKGWHELFAVAEIICAERSDVIFDFYGGPGAHESHQCIEKKFASSSNPSRILWHGELWGKNKTTALAQADLFCLPSWTEAFPIAILEAMACGLPVVATDVGGVSDAIENGVNGWLYPPKDEAALLNLLKSILSDRCQLQRIGKINRQKFLEQFSYEAFGLKWRQVLLGD